MTKTHAARSTRGIHPHRRDGIKQMRAFLRVCLWLLFAAPVGASSSPGFEPEPTHFHVGEQTYELVWTKEDLTRAKWDYESSDAPPLAPRAAYAKARAALAELRPAGENWQSLGFELNLSDATSYYTISFRLLSADGKKVAGFLSFFVFMDGQMIAPKLLPR